MWRKARVATPKALQPQDESAMDAPPQQQETKVRVAAEAMRWWNIPPEHKLTRALWRHYCAITLGGLDGPASLFHES